MNIIDVVPISKQSIPETLSYYCSDTVFVGQIATVPLRKKTIPALIVGVRKVTDAKSIIRSSNFQIRKAEIIWKDLPFTNSFLKAIAKTANYFARTEGSLLYSLTPTHLLEETTPFIEKKSASNKFCIISIQQKQQERYEMYASIVREHFGKKESVFLCVPSIQDAEKIYSSIKTGIEKYTYILHSSITPKQLQKRWYEAKINEHPVLIISTAMYTSIPRTDIGHIILEHESSEGYRTIGRGSVDLRFFIRSLAETISCPLTVGDTLLQTETLWEHTLNPHMNDSVLEHFLSSAQTNIMDMTKEKKSFIFHDKTTNLLENEFKNSHICILATRKGLAPLTVCQDCGEIVMATDSDTPMVLYESEKGNYFYSPHTREKRPADELCLHCGSWRLRPLGIGIDTIENELRELLPKAHIYKLDKNTTKTHRQAQKIINQFYESPSGILLGTEFALQYLTDPVNYSIVVSMDSLFAIPDFKIQEKILRTLITLRTHTSERIVIQTRNPNDKIFTYAKNGNTQDFYDQTISERKNFNLPPFFTLIKITVQNSTEHIQEECNTTASLFKKYLVDIYPARNARIRNIHIHNVLIRIPSDEWPSKKTLEILKHLPSTHTVEIDPVDIL